MPFSEEAKKILENESNDTVENVKTGESESQQNEINEEPTKISEEEENKELSKEMQKTTEEIEETAKGEEKQITDGSKILALIQEVASLREKQDNLEGKLIQTLKDNATFQIQVRQGMQKDLEKAKKKLSGDIFIPILKEIAELYTEWNDVIDDLEEGVAKRKVNGVFELLRELLEEYGCQMGSSEIGSKRNTRISKLKNKILVGDKSKHETIAYSHNEWMIKEPFILYPEYVDVYVYDASMEESETDENKKY